MPLFDQLFVQKCLSYFGLRQASSALMFCVDQYNRYILEDNNSR